MSGVPHISVAAGDAPTCKACEMRTMCYAQRVYPQPRDSYRANGVRLTSRVFDRTELPYINGNICRFNAFGELFSGKKGLNQLTNYANICNKNPDTSFVLWSRNYKLVESFFRSNEKPANLKLIRSTPTMNAPVDTIPAGWDGVFNVVTKEYAKENRIVINCGMKDSDGVKFGCARCPTGCYKMNNPVICYEIKK